MSIAEFAVSEEAVAAQPADSKKGKPPPKRQMTAKADDVLQPEPR
jgi:hypothetical protein